MATTQLSLAVAAAPKRPEPTKRCAKCATSKRLGDFYRDSARKDGRYHTCRDCVVGTRIPSRKRHDRAGCPECASRSVVFCTVCKGHRPPESFRVQSGRVMSFCIMCDNKRRRSPAEPRQCVVCDREFLRARKDQKICGDSSCKAEYSRSKAREKSFAEYGITEQDYRSMFAAQEGRCAICGTTNPGVPKRPQSDRLSVDHDHATGKVRGLLCQPCNSAIGRFRDDPETMRSAARYIEKHRETK